MVKPDVIKLFRDLHGIVEKIPADFGGGSPLSKTTLMVYLALENNLQNYVEIGVYRGRSFFPMAYAAKRLNGMAYGIDAFDCETAKEYDLEAAFADQLNQFLESVDFSQIHEDVIHLRQEMALSINSSIIKQTSSAAIKYFRRNGIAIDMLHVDGNHDTKHVWEDVDLYLPLVRNGGLVVLDDIDWDSVKPVFDQLKEKHELVFENGQFSVFLIGKSKRMITSLYKDRLKILNGMISNYELESAYVGLTVPEGIAITKISVVVISYNQEKFIAECLEGILAQKGDFSIELIFGDDFSTDSTLSIARDYGGFFCNRRIEMRIFPSNENIGMTKNLKRCLEACTGDYIAVCEGDDYWVDCYKLQKQMDFLRLRPECSFCFNDIYIYAQDSLEYTLFNLQQHLDADVLTTRELVLDNFIGNLSCCMYNAKFLKRIPANLFDLFIADWMLNIYWSQFGGIGHIKEAMSVYRKHNKGIWAGANPSDNAVHLHALIEEYNRYLHYDFDREFCVYQKRIEEALPGAFNSCSTDVTIIDDVFPHPLSAFRMEEFNSYLKEFESLKIYSSGMSVHVLGDKSLNELLIDFKRMYPEHSGRIERFGPGSRIDTRLMYMVFLENTYTNLAKIEELMVPFVFTLYPGGMFGLNNRWSDKMLKVITSSPCFRKVIVTQKITYNYLIEKKFCTPDQIEFIFGVVVPIEQINIDYVKKSNFGIDKNALDIAFVSYKYTEKGIDKGYDLFVDVAKELCKKYDNIRFHVVGGFDENVIDVTELGDRITFYGSRKTKWFDEFYRDKDIIMSPNIPFILYEGSFDGFPTGACVDAGLRKTAIFCTDELRLNTEFVDKEEIVIIPHNVDEVTEIVEYYYRNPEKLRAIAENGCRKIKWLYSYESQILPRIKILKAELDRAEISRKAILKVMDRFVLRRYLSRTIIAILKGMKRICPVFLKKLLKKIMEIVRSNERLKSLIKRFCPGFLLRSYLKIRASL